METQQLQAIRRYIDMLMRRKVLIISFLLLGCTAGLVVYLLQPKIYQSTSLLSYKQQKINPTQMSPDQQEQIRDIVSTLSQIITSRTNLERIINEVGLYQEARKNLPMEDVIDTMRRNIEITPSKQGDTFVITFMGSNPRQVVQVTNTLAAGFIDENLKYREERASETSAYIADELDMAKNILDRKEAVMRDYKLKYYNEMPEQRATNMARLIALQQQYQDKQESIQDLERTRVLIQDQIIVRKQLLAAADQQSAARSDAGSAPPESDRAKLERLRRELPLLQQRYTERHPTIIQIKSMIARLEQAVAAAPLDQPEEQAPVNIAEPVDHVVAEFQLQLKDIALNIEELAKEKETIKKQIDQYEQWVAAAPVREAEWSSLTREYGELKRHYDFLVAQNLQARSALNLERTQKGSQFKIEDPARMSEKPVKPDFLKIMGLALLAGCGLGAVLAFGLEFFDTSCKHPDELQSSSGLEVICVVPLVVLPREKRRALMIDVALAVVVSSYGLVLVGALIYLWSKGKIII